MTKGPGLLPSDFWWLPSDIDLSMLRVGVFNHDSMTDVDRSAHFWPVHIGSQDVLSSLEDARRRAHNINVYRTFTLFDLQQQPHVVGPFVIDVDNGPKDADCVQNLEDALRVTRAVVELLAKKYRLRTDDFRIYFTGCKGFNVEVRPQAFGITGSIGQQAKLSYMRLEELIDELRRQGTLGAESGNQCETSIDHIYRQPGTLSLMHQYLRLHNSVNGWISSDGQRVARAKMEIELGTLPKVNAAGLCRESEELAQRVSS